MINEIMRAAQRQYDNMEDTSMMTGSDPENIEECPECGSTIIDTDGNYTWCIDCDWTHEDNDDQI